MLGINRRYIIEGFVRSVRYYCTAEVPNTVVDKSVLSKLRKKTGFPLLSCKKALQKYSNDIKQAEEWLREEAQKEGWAKATKLQGRPMSQGLVGLIRDENSATLLELNCETDFVAKNEKFQSLVARVTDVCHNYFSQNDEDQVLLIKEELNSLTVEGSKLADLVALQVGSVGENMALRRASYMRTTPSTVLSTYIHASGPQVVKDNCKLGKFGALVKVEPPDVHQVAAVLCQHIVGMNPKEIGTPEAPRAEKKVEKKKKKSGEIEELKEQTVDEDEEREELKERLMDEEERQLLRQEFILDPSLTVHQFLENNTPKVVDFVRFECGEVLPGDDD